MIYIASIKYGLESSGHSVYQLTYHIMWCVKYRRSILTLEIGKRLKEIIETLVKESGYQLLAIENEVDHVQLVITHQISKLINSYNGVIARKLFQEFPGLKNQLWRRYI